jgi:predicted Rossmann fold nucleotide-binding protein DprA/Smf involved in DNA uptake
MTVAIIGSRKFTNYREFLQLMPKLDITKIISGGATGADSLAHRYALDNDIAYLEFLPDWDLYGKAAGPIRNKLIINNADHVIAFWDGRSKGTASSIKLAQHKGISINVITI